MKTLLTECRHGKFLLLRGDMISQFVQLYGEWCEAEVELFQSLLTADNNVAEVGCNIGLHTVPLARFVPRGKVFAFEPQRIICNLACANISLNNITNSYIFNCAVGECRKQVMIETCDYEQGWNYGAFSLNQGFSGEEVFPVTTRQEVCHVVALDEVINTQIHLLKIDAEGYEHNVLDGASNLIKQQLPVIFIENNRQETCDSLISKISGYGYQCFWFISPRYRSNNFFNNYIAVNKTADINMLCIPDKRSVSLNWSLQPATNWESLKKAIVC